MNLELPDEQHVTIPVIERQTINNREECSKELYKENN